MPESKKMFLKSLNALVDAKEETIENMQGLIETVCQTESLDAEQEQLEQELEALIQDFLTVLKIS